MLLADESYVKSVTVLKYTVFIKHAFNHLDETLLVSLYYISLHFDTPYLNLICFRSEFILQSVHILLMIYFNSSVMEKTNIYLYFCFFWMFSLDLFYMVSDMYFLVPWTSVKHQIWIASARSVKHRLKIY